MKKNIFFVLTSDLFVRNYIFTEALKEIENNNNIYFLACDKNVTIRKEIERKKNFLGFYIFTNRQINAQKTQLSAILTNNVPLFRLRMLHHAAVTSFV